MAQLTLLRLMGRGEPGFCATTTPTTSPNGNQVPSARRMVWNNLPLDIVQTYNSPASPAQLTRWNEPVSNERGFSARTTLLTSPNGVNGPPPCGQRACSRAFWRIP